jgi:hypothetical protein
VVSLFLALAASCASEGDAGTDDGGSRAKLAHAEGRAVEAGSVTVLVAGRRSGGSDQRIVGTIREINGCLGLELNRRSRWIAVFPEGSEVAGDGRSVTLTNGHELRVADFIEAAGDFYERGDAPVNAPDVPAKCGDLSAALLSDPRVIEQG